MLASDLGITGEFLASLKEMMRAPAPALRWAPHSCGAPPARAYTSTDVNQARKSASPIPQLRSKRVDRYARKLDSGFLGIL